MLSLLASVVAQISTGPADPPSWGTLLVSTVSSIPIATLLLWQLKEGRERERAKDDVIKAKDDVIREKDQEIADLNAKQLALAERALPALVQSAGTIADMRDATKPASQELALLLHDLRGVTDDLKRSGRGQR